MDIWLRALLTFVVFGLATAWRPFTLELKDFSCENFHPEIMVFNLTSKNDSFFDLSLHFIRDTSELFMDLVVLHDSGKEKYDLVFTNKTIDFCMFLKNKKTNILFDIGYKLMSGYGEFPKKCPIRKKRYELLNIFADPEMLPPFMPDHRAKVRILNWNKQNGVKTILSKYGLSVVVERAYKINGNG